MAHPDLREVDHGPTRQDRSIDRSFVNFKQAVVASGTTVPLEAESGATSDHRVAYFNAEFEVQTPKQVSYTYRAFTPEGAERFAERLALERWDGILSAGTVDEKAAAYQAVMDQLMDDCFA